MIDIFFWIVVVITALDILFLMIIYGFVLALSHMIKSHMIPMMGGYSGDWEDYEDLEDHSQGLSTLPKSKN